MGSHLECCQLRGGHTEVNPHPATPIPTDFPCPDRPDFAVAIGFDAEPEPSARGSGYDWPRAKMRQLKHTPAAPIAT